MAKPRSIIFIQPEAPAKPAWGSVCNGCGVCCLVEPCPLGMVLSRRSTGACEALRWSETDRVYRCGAVSDPSQVLSSILPRWISLATVPLTVVLRWLAPRWISSGSGCDSTLDVTTPSGRISTDVKEPTEPAKP
ncbi:MAG: hypothetical protein EAZ54_00340 [Curvibacter sp.]|nr:MAG: hypothetical protein EAZ54_00340 [Curvibacter sp.]